jgi:hypothetical protein
VCRVALYRNFIVGVFVSNHSAANATVAASRSELLSS